MIHPHRPFDEFPRGLAHRVGGSPPIEAGHAAQHFSYVIINHFDYGGAPGHHPIVPRGVRRRLAYIPASSSLSRNQRSYAAGEISLGLISPRPPQKTLV